MHPQQQGFVDSVTFHAQRNTSGETQSAPYSIALFVASDATDTWQSCCETVTQGCVTLWSEPAVSVCRRQNKERSQCLPSFFSVLLQPPPFFFLCHALLLPPPAHTLFSPSHTLFSSSHTLFIYTLLLVLSLPSNILTSPLTNPPSPSPSPPRD